MHFSNGLMLLVKRSFSARSTVLLFVCFILAVGCGSAFQAYNAEDPQVDTTDPAINVMSFNIRFDNPDDGQDAWAYRDDRVVSMIRFYKADLVGAQEALHNQIEDMEEQMPEYDWVGVGRDDGAEEGEYSPIFYRADRFEVIDHDTFWLSETPDQVGSVGWDAALPRIVTWARLNDRVTGHTIRVFNTHFDHRGDEARRQSARLLADSVQSVSDGEQVIVTGDFNVSPDTEAYATMTKVLEDTKERSELPPHGPEETFSGFEVTDELGDRIDYIFVQDDARVLRYGTLTDQWYGRYPSDHLPVLAEIAFSE